MSPTNYLLAIGVLLVVECSINVSAVSVEKYLTLTLRQKNALDKFRKTVEPILKESYMKQDTYLIQWLRARNFDIHSAEQMLRANLKWRKENGIDNIENEDWSDMISDFHATMDTYDKTGRPVGVIDIYDWDIRRAVIQGKAPRLLRYIVWLVENVTTQVYERQEKLGMNVTQVVVLGNANGFNIIQHGCPLCLPYWIQFIQIIENYYPEALDELIIFDAPPTIQIVLEAIKPVLSKTTRDAIRVFGPNRAKWTEYLDKKISKEERRKQYGGTKPPYDFSR